MRCAVHLLALKLILAGQHLTFLNIRIPAILFLFSFGVAFAHADLESATPAQNAVLSESPAEVVLTYSEEVEVRFSTFKVYPLETSRRPQPTARAPARQRRCGGPYE